MRAHRRSINEPGHAHELTFSCYRRYPWLEAERCRRWFAESLRSARNELAFELWAYVLMPDHVHLIVYPTRERHEMGAILRAIKGPVGEAAMAYLEAEAPEWLPRVTRRRGERVERLFWQSGGGYDRNITTSKTLLAMIDYLHANPVRKGSASGRRTGSGRARERSRRASRARLTSTRFLRTGSTRPQLVGWGGMPTVGVAGDAAKRSPQRITTSASTC